MVWKLEHLPPKFRNLPPLLDHFLREPMEIDHQAEGFRVAIIGGGPKGFYGLERLLNSLPENSPRVEIHWFNETEHFASGNNYRIDQPEYLLINYNIGNINIWVEEEQDPERVSLLDWVENHRQITHAASFTDYASRALVGAYLTDGLQNLLQKHSASAEISLIVGQVTDMVEKNGGYGLTVNGDVKMSTYQKILVATGHSQTFNSDQEKLFKAFSKSKSSTYFLPKVYPVAPTLTALPERQKVAIKGVGLTFIDAILGLTEGKGGEFVRNETGLTYCPSGLEPKRVYAFSRTSLPMLPRGPIHPARKYKLQLFTQAYVEQLKKDHSGHKIDFKEQVEPLVRREITYAYYSTLMKGKQFRFPEEEAGNFERFQKLIQEFQLEYPEEIVFDFDLFLDPFKNNSYTSGKDFHHAVLAYLKYGLKEARKGEMESPLMAAVAVWRELVPIMGQLYSFGGFTAESQQYFDSKICGPLSRVTFGPPVINTEKLIALAEAGMLSFKLGPAPKINTPSGKSQFELESSIDNFQAEVDVLVDARIARPNWRSGNSPFFESIYKQGLGRPFSNEGYHPGCCEINRSGQLINQAGKPNEHIFVTGTPTEGMTFDNDTLSRKRNNFTEYWAKNVLENLSRLPLEK